ncbi:MAG: inorganic phosphate transporter [Candidatus Aenigmarchaeota archaeon]|nr:inorganic phosphate transporter [Candidatus Aenigmarchaeota archaeon]
MGLSIFFAFWNGFTDASYAICDIIGTRALKPIHAVIMATVCNMIGILFGTAVAFTIATGIISESMMSGEVIIAALVGALIFDVITSWVYALPISETHVLIGGLIGAGIGAGGLGVVKYVEIINKVLTPMIVLPFISIIATFIIGCLLIRSFRGFAASKVNRCFKILQVLISMIFSITNGGNAGQKIMGIMTILLVYYGYLSQFIVPFWVIISTYITLSLGIFLGGWKVVQTMATKITRLKPYQGVAIDVVGSLILGFTALTGYPMSSTHVINGTIIGAGLCQRTKAIKWGMTRKIIVAWVLSIPLSAIMAYIIFNIIKFFV